MSNAFVDSDDHVCFRSLFRLGINQPLRSWTWNSTWQQKSRFDSWTASYQYHTRPAYAKTRRQAEPVAGTLESPFWTCIVLVICSQGNHAACVSRPGDAALRGRVCAIHFSKTMADHLELASYDLQDPQITQYIRRRQVSAATEREWVTGNVLDSRSSL